MSEQPPASGPTSGKRRPIRGVKKLRRPARIGVEEGITRPRSYDVYVSPVFPDGVPGSALSAQPPDYQAAAALHWFQVNFRPVIGLNELSSSDGSVELSSDGSPSPHGSPSYPPDSPDTGLVDDFGRGLADDEGRRLVADSRALPTPFDVLHLEFVGLIADDLLLQLDEGLRTRSPRWQFIPFPDPLPIELDGVARLQSEVDAVRVRRDVEELEAHLVAQTTAPPAYGQNYWPGAELLDEGLRQEIKAVARALREAVVAEVTPVEPVKESVGRLVGIRNKVGQWLAEGAVRAIGGAAGLAALTAAGAAIGYVWWHWLYHLLTQLLTDGQAWVLSLTGG